MKKKTIKVKSYLSKQEITLTFDEKLDKLNPNDFAPEKQQAAIDALPKNEKFILR